MSSRYLAPGQRDASRNPHHSQPSMPKLSKIELQRKLSDAKYWIETFFWIVDKKSVKVPFILNVNQALYYAKRTGRDIILKAKKMGFSALITAIFLHACITRKYTRAVLVSHEKEATVRLFKRVVFYLKTCGVNIKISDESKQEIVFPDTESSFWIGTAGQRAFGRGDDITHYHISEMAFYEHPEILTGIEEGCVDDAYGVIESTANGMGNKFHEVCLKAIAGESNYAFHFFAWWQNPEYRIESGPFELAEDEKKLKDALDLDWAQLAWRRNKIRGMSSPELFPQEYPSTWEEAFLTSGSMYFDWTALKKMEENVRPVKGTYDIRDAGGEIKLEPSPKGCLTIWRGVERNARYIIAGDVSEGIQGLDRSVADVYDSVSWEQVAQWTGYTPPDKFGDIMMWIGAVYNWALLIPEVNSVGMATGLHIKSTPYPNLHYEPERTDNEGVGWKTTGKSRPIMLTDAREAVRDFDVRLNSKDSINECRTFVVGDNGKAEAQTGCYDDRVLTLAIAIHQLKNLHYNPEERKQTFREVLSRTPKSRRGITAPRFKRSVV